ncbi:DUF3916 domain-containing protein [Bacillus salipaludis]|uniref:DUF3916 domain-containing protein n=1 Tax=Bacillus salipaludis TaxID=2547811 RepID=A0AA90R510_9BACI|nr:DUF3916 domain-containing protein [Bacillus salipaludis]MDQ6600713.1 DUF3916 domain-containing protein [Bacillus salipaludis]
MVRKKKIRGKRRKFRNIRNKIAVWSQSLPAPPDQSPTYLGYRAYSFNIAKDFGDFNKFPKANKREFLQMIINFVKDLHDLKTDKEKEYRIIAYFPMPDLPYVVVMIGYTKAGLDSFYAGLNHNGKFSEYFTPTANTQFLEKDWGLYIPEGLEVKGFEGDSEEYFEGSSSIWFVGNVK